MQKPGYKKNYRGGYGYNRGRGGYNGKSNGGNYKNDSAPREPQIPNM